MTLTHDWYTGVDGQGRWYVHGGQPNDNGVHPYVIQVVESEGDIAVAAEQIAAALRGEG